MRTGAIVNWLKKKRNEGLSNAAATTADSTDVAIYRLDVASIPAIQRIAPIGTPPLDGRSLNFVCDLQGAECDNPLLGTLPVGSRAFGEGGCE
jgi:hypothetical protein